MKRLFVMVLALMLLAAVALGEKAPAPAAETVAETAETTGAAKTTGTSETAETAETAGMGEIMVGGWKNVEAEAQPLPEDAQAAFDKAMEGLVGAEYTPVALLSTQLVSGTNYCILCQIKPVVLDPVPAWALVYIYADLQGNAEIMNVYDLYIDRHAFPEE